MHHSLRGSLTTWAPEGLGDPLPTDWSDAFRDRPSGEVLHVSGWRAAGWIAAHLRRSSRTFGWLRLDGCRTLADCILVLGTSMDLPVPGRLADVAAALGELNLRDIGIDARTVSGDLPGPLCSAVSPLSPTTRWWAAIHEPLPLANHVATTDDVEPVDTDTIPATIEAGVWFPQSPRVRLNLPGHLQRPDALPGALRVDVSAELKRHPRRSLGAIVDGLIGPHSELFSIATETPHNPIAPADLFALRLLAENASDGNVACLAGAAAIRCRLTVGQPAEALERAEQVLVRTQRADPAHRALVVWAESVVLLQTGPLHRAQARFADAVALAESSRDKGLLATMNRRWADRLAARRLFRQASLRYRIALGLYRQRGDAEGIAATTRGAADVAVAADELLSAEALFEQADANTTTAPEHVNRLLGQLGLAIASRQWDRASKVRQRILRIGLATPVDQANFDRREADRALRSGDSVSAAAHLESARTRYQQAGERAAAAGCVRAQADAAALQGDIARAWDLYRAALEAHVTDGDWLGLARTLEHIAHLDRSRGNEVACAELLDLSRELTIAGGG